LGCIYRLLELPWLTGELRRHCARWSVECLPMCHV
jgi:hypothetical protein